MAAQQTEGGVPFAIAHEMQHFRLLELPPELLELLDCQDPPKLHIKSQPSTAKSANAVLCTPDKTFQLRQVQTSNSLYVTRPTLYQAEDKGTLAPTTCAIGSCAVTLELHPDQGSAVHLMRNALPVYHQAGEVFDAEENRKSQDAVFAEIAFSQGQCQQAWTELLGFEVGGSSYRPSVRSLVQVWTAINAAALAEGIRLDGQSLASDIVRLVEDEGYPASLVEAVLHHLAAEDQTSGGDWCCLDRRKTVTFTGKTLLLAKQETSDYVTEDFLSAWGDCLPEDWRADAELEALRGEFEHPTATTIRSKTETATSSTTDAVPSKPSAARKWHDKFAKTRTK